MLGFQALAHFLLPNMDGTHLGDSSLTCDVDANPQNEAKFLAQQLRGKTLRIPDLTKLFAQWPCAANPHAERLKATVDSMLESITTDERKLRGLKRADFARLVALLVLICPPPPQKPPPHPLTLVLTLEAAGTHTHHGLSSRSLRPTRSGSLFGTTRSTRAVAKSRPT